MPEDGAVYLTAFHLGDGMTHAVRHRGMSMCANQWPDAAAHGPETVGNREQRQHKQSALKGQ